jgi:hypothetical protein
MLVQVKFNSNQQVRLRQFPAGLLVLVTARIAIRGPCGLLTWLLVLESINMACLMLQIIPPSFLLMATGTAKDRAGSNVAASTNDYVALVSLPVKTKILPALVFLYNIKNENKTVYIDSHNAFHIPSGHWSKFL